MLKLKTALIAFVAAIAFAVTAGVGPVAQAGDWPTDKQCKKVAKDADSILKGWCAAINRKGGNCLACHQAMVNPWPEGFPQGGNIGPPLVAMASRFPNREDLRAQIWDPTVKNPQTSMPPFGRHKLISEQDIDNIVDWLLSI
ncbi:MAG: sulfur oxidation c-type cytochrome SoxX [Acidiferrobacteraceae bacterium]|jgi:sulfur-oxidizing protein SoxX|nr:sulfur oxidation c-type cytochrome SoxX [Acidiferrobacteraceae bacterium]MCP4827632.1 sulfur oxidation c-type cytochrome SoxX [Pseudomonadota bacterium]MDP6950850.1 sulfur oxidation c-type cytochrome SoxX [Arenicellales bacterium]HJP07425.1 sulfur oxidation c-type cytochrome SoxX [Arenicellales bacterium]|tara:strand:- start:4832 stop:5257 length:426 start_codon:yes stop_codon:yes gene_type:complete